MPSPPSSATRARWWPRHGRGSGRRSRTSSRRQQPGAMADEVEPVLQRRRDTRLRRPARRPRRRCRRTTTVTSSTPRAPASARRSSASASGLRQVLPVQTNRMRVLMRASLSRREPPDGPAQLGARDRPFAHHARHRRRCSRPASTAARCRARRRRAPAARPARTASAKQRRRCRRRPAPAGRPGRLAEVEVSGTPSAATSRAMPACDVCRTAMPPSAPAQPSGSRPSPPAQHQRQRPGPERVRQRARRRGEDEALLLGHRRGPRPAAGTASSAAGP